MVNLTGKNASGSKQYPPDVEFKKALEDYASKGFSQKEKIAWLGVEFQLSIGYTLGLLTKLNEFERKFGILSVRRQHLSTKQQTQAILDEAQKDVTQNNSPNYIKGILRMKQVPVPRALVRKVIHSYFPAGAEKRFPGYKKPKVKRQPLTAMGPFHEIVADGHEKMGALALQMDKWSGKLVKLEVLPDCQSAGAIGHQFLDLILELGGIPLQLNLDKVLDLHRRYIYSETVLREAFASEIDPAEYPEVALLQSIHNIIIESLWRWLQEKSGHNMRDIILQGKENGIILTNIESHRNLFHWIFVPLVQAELDEFCRCQPKKLLPSNHVPEDAVKHPELYAGLDCLIHIPEATVHDLRQYITEEVGSKKDFTTFFPAAFGAHANEVFFSIGSPILLFGTAWNVFEKMIRFIE
ncbi:hypothetical protein CPB83DRAFT_872218 [Crepidotus variabilis]|uniref:Uncharacterized protein n=1 Tax=Crepidotus variabilis TaxID=179855 RepID=A0A9P6BBP7_9AGAR|nr:hypothetical protein CPB83DRAFT_872218 [Crepidotus variabilis]